MIRILPALPFLLAACAVPPTDAPEASSGDRHAYVWSMAMDSTGHDALLVLDVDTASATYGQVIGEHALDTAGAMPHHIERRVSADGRLMANGWVANTSWVFDVTAPTAPTVHATFQSAGGIMAWAHDFARLPSGNALVAFNAGPGAYVGPGGIAEVDRDGAVVQSAMATMAGLGDTAATPYVVMAVAGRDRALVGLGEMGMGADYPFHFTSMLQLWSTQPLAPIAMIPLPSHGTDIGHVAPSSIEMTSAGEVFANTFMCGLYRVTGLDGDAPVATRVYTFPGGTDETLCSVATTIGDYWIQAVAALPGLIVLDTRDPAAPREVSRLVLDSTAYAGLHWVSANRQGTRLAITGGGPWLVMARFDPATGAVSLDPQFGSPNNGLPGIIVRNPAGQMLHPHGVAWGP